MRSTLFFTEHAVGSIICQRIGTLDFDMTKRERKRLVHEAENLLKATHLLAKNAMLIAIGYGANSDGAPGILAFYEQPPVPPAHEVVAGS